MLYLVVTAGPQKNLSLYAQGARVVPEEAKAQLEVLRAQEALKSANPSFWQNTALLLTGGLLLAGPGAAFIKGRKWLLLSSAAIAPLLGWVKLRRHTKQLEESLKSAECWLWHAKQGSTFVTGQIAEFLNGMKRDIANKVVEQQLDSYGYRLHGMTHHSTTDKELFEEEQSSRLAAMWRRARVEVLWTGGQVNENDLRRISSSENADREIKALAERLTALPEQIRYDELKDYGLALQWKRRPANLVRDLADVDRLTLVAASPSPAAIQQF